MINVLFFGPVSDMTGCREYVLPYTAGISVQSVLAHVEQRFPSVMSKISFIAVNEMQVRDHSMPLSDGDDVALLAKFSGG